MAEPYTILYEDKDLIVCDKAPGLPVQSARLGVKDLTGLLKTYLRETADALASEPYLAVIHRLDQPVRGLVIFAKNKKSAADLSAQVQDGRMEKIYLARVYLPEGKSAQQMPAEGVLTDYLVKDAKKNMSAVTTVKTKDAKKAVLEYRLLTNHPYAQEVQAAEGRTTAVFRIHLLTGRHHQIRVQMSHAGMPLVGDHKYAAGIDAAKFPCLCAAQLSFIHPRTGKQMQFSVIQA